MHEGSKVSVLYSDWTEAELKKKNFPKERFKSNLHNFTPLEANDLK